MKNTCVLTRVTRREHGLAGWVARGSGGPLAVWPPVGWARPGLKIEE